MWILSNTRAGLTSGYANRARAHTRWTRLCSTTSTTCTRWWPRLGAGHTNFLAIKIFGEQGALRFNSEAPSCLDVFDGRDPDQPLGGLSGFRRVRTVSRYPGQKAPDATMPSDFVRTHVEIQYRFLKAVSDDEPPSPCFAAGLHVQEVMEAALISAAEKRWVAMGGLRSPG
jgi:predicted dehydrogenase